MKTITNNYMNEKLSNLGLLLSSGIAGLSFDGGFLVTLAATTIFATIKVKIYLQTMKNLKLDEELKKQQLNANAKSTN